jgi:transposase
MSPKVTKRKRRLFTPEFKSEAVRLVRASGKTVAMVARELDLTATCLRAWVNQASVDEKGEGQGPLTTDERAELTVATGERGYQIHRRHRCPGTHPVARRRFFALTVPRRHAHELNFTVRTERSRA